MASLKSQCLPRVTQQNKIAPKVPAGSPLLCCRMSLLGAAVLNDHGLGDFEQQNCALSRFWGPETHHQGAGRLGSFSRSPVHGSSPASGVCRQSLAPRRLSPISGSVFTRPPPRVSVSLLSVQGHRSLDRGPALTPANCIGDDPTSKGGPILRFQVGRNLGHPTHSLQAQRPK